jgi:hypothetical protein
MSLTTPTEHKWILGDKFDQVYPHLEGIQALWEKKWAFPCSKSLYPFHDGKFEDFEPVFKTLISKNINSGYTDEYTREFVPTAERLIQEADKLVASDKDAASALYLRACTVYRIARFPYINSDYKTEIYEAQKKAYIKAASLWDCPIKDVTIPHTAATSADAKSVPLYVRIPKDASKSKPCPAVLLMCGLDGHRPDNTTRSDEFLARGWASIIVDIPGTADCPADRKDPEASERLWTSILDWMAEEGVYDMKRIITWGLSAGGYNAVCTSESPSFFFEATLQVLSTNFYKGSRSTHPLRQACRRYRPRCRYSPFLLTRMARKGTKQGISLECATRLDRKVWLQGSRRLHGQRPRYLVSGQDWRRKHEELPALAHQWNNRWLDAY